MAPAAAWSRSRSRPGRARMLPLYAVVDEAQFGVAFQGVARDALRRLPRVGWRSYPPWPVVRRRPGHRSPRGDCDCSMAGQAPLAFVRDPESLPPAGRVVIGSRSRPFQRTGHDRDQDLICNCDRLILRPSELEMAGDGRAEWPASVSNVIMSTPPLRDRGLQPALEGDRVGAAILARTSVGAAFWK